jgi:formate hydrogenlyase subunit 3/multisubunit Na+/H+ antiporter MnhD subunit
MFTALIGTSLGVMLFAGAVAPLLARTRYGKYSTDVLFLASSALAVGASGIFFVSTTEVVSIFSSPLLALSATTLGMFFFVLIALSVFLTSLSRIVGFASYAGAYSSPYAVLAYAGFVVSAQLVTLVQTALSFLFFWELMLVAGFGFLAVGSSRESLRAAVSYFLIVYIGFCALVVAFSILTSGYILASWSDTAQTAQSISSSDALMVGALLCIGFASNAGIAPFYRWFVSAYTATSRHAFAMLSGIVPTIALFGFIQSVLLLPALPFLLGVFVLLSGLLSVCIGVSRAVSASDRISSLVWMNIGNTGLIFSGLGGIVVLQPFSSLLAPVLISTVAVYTAVSTVGMAILILVTQRDNH